MGSGGKNGKNEMADVQSYLNNLLKPNMDQSAKISKRNSNEASN